MMDFSLTEDQEAMRAALKESLHAWCPPATVRAAWTSDDGPGVGRRLAGSLGEIGVPAALVAQSAGGLGLGESDAWPLWKELGYAAVPVPALETSSLVAPLLESSGDAAGWLDDVLAGRIVATAALEGELIPFPWADVVVVLHRDRRTASIARLEDLDLDPASSVDGARPLARVANASALRRLDVDEATVNTAAERAVLSMAAALTGVSRRMLDMTVDYVKTREQFGRPVGEFQAIKHLLASTLLRIEESESAVANAAWYLEHGSPPTFVEVSTASWLARGCAESTAKASLQCHGAIGYTIEYDLHMFAKRAWAWSTSWGSAEDQVDRVVDALGLAVHS